MNYLSFLIIIFPILGGIIMLKAIFFDLDGTLLPMDEDSFIKLYFNMLCNKVENKGYKKEELIDCIWKGTYAMYKNDGSKSNEEVFWNYFESIYGKEKLDDKALFDDFYKNEFKNTKSACKENPLAREIVEFAKKNVQTVVLSTNPIFPSVGTEQRMNFVDLKKEDFDFITVYENSSYAKPNPKYFLWLLEKFNLKPEEVILFGNNSLEDGDCASYCNIKCYLVGDFIIHNPKAKGVYEEIKIEDIIPTIKKEIQLRK